MDVHFPRIRVVGWLLSVLIMTSAQDDVPRPTFPETFETEIQGIDKGAMEEFDAEIHFDRINNRAAMVFTQEGSSIKSIYNFNDKLIITIHGEDCSVVKLTKEFSDDSFFPFHVDDENNMFLADPEEFFHFTKSTFERQEFLTLPTYVYSATVDLPLYRRKNCEVSHFFSKPEVELPDCEGHICKPTLMAITLKCPKTEEQELLDEVYNFYRLRSGIKDESVFQTPEGTYCNIPNMERFPGLPDYFSFSYRILEDMEGGHSSAGVYSLHRKVWYDTKLRLIRVDEFDANKLLETSRIYDSYGGMAYTTVALVSKCFPGPIDDDISYGRLTTLPNVLFVKPYNDTVYVGKRTVNALEYFVWSLSYTDEETDAQHVQEFYFSKILLNDDGYSNLELSHINLFVSERNDDTQDMERSVVTYIAISNLRSKPKEWEAFDISSCFSNEQKRGFRLKVQGPPIIKSSYMYEDLLEHLYKKLIEVTKISVIRINQLKGTFDGVNITEFTGWILDKPKLSNKPGNLEPDMHTAYKLIEDAASAGKLSLEITSLAKDIKYIITAVEEVKVTRSSSNGCFTGGSLAAAGLILFALGIFFGTVCYYVFLKKRTPRSSDKVHLTPLEGRL